jgi:hypothetical protein
VIESKKACPNLMYIEACNEYALKGFIGCSAEEYYRFYQAACRAVNEANRQLGLTGADRILIGGPVVTGDIIKKLDLFFANYAADPSPDKRLDFISWHEYSKPYADTAHRQRQVEAMLARHGLPQDVPMFVTEHDPYHPHSESRPHNLINGAGLVKSLYFTAEHSPNIKLMPWVLYHIDTIQTRFMWFDGPNEPDTRAEDLRMLPIGCSMKLLSMHGEWEIRVDNALERDEIVLASVQNDGLVVHAVNYGSTRNVQVRIENLAKLFPAEANGSFKLVKYLVDEHHSNAVTRSDYPGGLEVVATETVQATGGAITLEHRGLDKNGIVFWKLTPERIGPKLAPPGR